MRAAHDRRIDAEERLADRADEGEIALPVAAVEIIEEDAADAARLAAVLEKEILVAPFLEARVAVRRRSASQAACERGVEFARAAASSG